MPAEKGFFIKDVRYNKEGKVNSVRVFGSELPKTEAERLAAERNGKGGQFRVVPEGESVSGDYGTTYRDVMNRK